MPLLCKLMCVHILASASAQYPARCQQYAENASRHPLVVNAHQAKELYIQQVLCCFEKWLAVLARAIGPDI